jgi:hypothetical protein
VHFNSLTEEKVLYSTRELFGTMENRDTTSSKQSPPTTMFVAVGEGEDDAPPPQEQQQQNHPQGRVTFPRNSPNKSLGHGTVVPVLSPQLGLLLDDASTEEILFLHSHEEDDFHSPQKQGDMDDYRNDKAQHQPSPPPPRQEDRSIHQPARPPLAESSTRTNDVPHRSLSGARPLVRMGSMLSSKHNNNSSNQNSRNPNYVGDNDDDDDDDDDSDEERPGAFRVNGRHHNSNNGSENDDDDNDTTMEYYNHPDNRVSRQERDQAYEARIRSSPTLLSNRELARRAMATTTTVATSSSSSSLHNRAIRNRAMDTTPPLPSPLEQQKQQTAVWAHLVDEQAEKRRYMAETEHEIRAKILSEAVAASATLLVVETTKETTLADEEDGGNYSYRTPKRGNNDASTTTTTRLLALDPHEKRRRWKMRVMFCLLLGLGVGVGVLMANRPSPSSPISTGGEEVPVNDRCDTAIALMIHDQPIFHSTVGATVEDNLRVVVVVGNTTNGTVGTTNDATTREGMCPNATALSTLRGVWYTVVGTGLPLQVSTCYRTNFDTQLLIFRGLDCQAAETAEFECIAYNDNGPSEYCGASLESSVTWTTVFNETYHVLVAGSNQEDGTFGLQVVETVVNDVCETSIGPIPIDSTPILGSTEGATWEGDHVVFGTCADEVVVAGEDPKVEPGRGVWYTVTGTGAPLVASTCHDGTTFNTQLSVFQGSCGAAGVGTIFNGTNSNSGNTPTSSQLVCLAANDNQNKACPLQDAMTTASTVTWATLFGQVYWILVHGRDNSAGQFVLTITEAVQNDLCETARHVLDDFLDLVMVTPMLINATNINNDTLSGVATTTTVSSELSILQGSTRNATVENDHAIPQCLNTDEFDENGVSIASPPGPGVWYEMSGNGYYWTAVFNPRCPKSLKDQAAQPLPKLSVYTGASSCESLSCQTVSTTTMATTPLSFSADVDDRGCSVTSETPVQYWYAVQEVMYHILVEDYLSYWTQVVASAKSISSNATDDDFDDLLKFDLVLNQITPGISCSFPQPFDAPLDSIRQWVGIFPPTNTSESNPVLLDCMWARTNETDALENATVISTLNDTGTTPSPLTGIVWHSIVGTGGLMRVSSSCINRLAVYTGSCQGEGSLKCVVVQADDPCSEKGGNATFSSTQSFQWYSGLDEMYYIVISYGSVSGISGGASGTSNVGSDHGKDEELVHPDETYALTIEVNKPEGPLDDSKDAGNPVQTSPNMVVVAALVVTAVVVVVVGLLMAWHHYRCESRHGDVLRWFRHRKVEKNDLT